MANYFDPTTDAHLSMLPKSMREYDELESEAGFAEADVIDFYTARVPSSENTVRDLNHLNGVFVSGRDSTEVGSGTGLRVFLLGYAVDADQVDTTLYPNFKDDMRRTIARVLRWRLQRLRREMDVVSEADDTGRSKTYVSDMHREFPPGWNRLLAKYDTREPTWAL